MRRTGKAPNVRFVPQFLGRKSDISGVFGPSRRFHVPRRMSGGGRPDHRQGVGVGGGIDACVDGLRKKRKEKAAHPNPRKD